LTLTFKNTPELQDFSYYRNCFTKLRRRRFWKKLCGGILGGAVAFETTIDENGWYHPHFHVFLIVKDAVPVYPTGDREGQWELEYQNVISEAWQEITGDSYIVDVRTFDGNFKELVKYATKVNDMPDEPIFDKALRELYRFSRSRRFVQTFGNMYGRLEEEEADAPNAEACPDCGATEADAVLMRFDDKLGTYVPHRVGRKVIQDGRPFYKWEPEGYAPGVKQFILSERLTSFSQVKDKPVRR
jgi:hypothetical protein